jgi:hypothetical protein
VSDSVDFRDQTEESVRLESSLFLQAARRVAQRMKPLVRKGDGMDQAEPLVRRLWMDSECIPVPEEFVKDFEPPALLTGWLWDEQGLTWERFRASPVWLQDALLTRYDEGCARRREARHAKARLEIEGVFREPIQHAQKPVWRPSWQAVTIGLISACLLVSAVLLRRHSW